MWLPKNERLLLSFYYRQLEGKYDDSLDLSREIIIASMKELDSSLESQGDIGDMLEMMGIPSYKDIRNSHRYLEDRKLLLLDNSLTGRITDGYGQTTYKMKCVSLTADGYDLGRKYCFIISQIICYSLNKPFISFLFP